MSSATDDREVRRQRAAKNQSLFREVNERIKDLVSPDAYATFICECLDEACASEVAVTVDEYEHVRAESNSFFVLPGHNVVEVEEVVETTERYLVVKKLGSGRPVAERLDPRKRPGRHAGGT